MAARSRIKLANRQVGYRGMARFVAHLCFHAAIHSIHSTARRRILTATQTTAQQSGAASAPIRTPNTRPAIANAENSELLLRRCALPDVLFSAGSGLLAGAVAAVVAPDIDFCNDMPGIIEVDQYIPPPCHGPLCSGLSKDRRRHGNEWRQVLHNCCKP
jgi:hypothetical protein